MKITKKKLTAVIAVMTVVTLIVGSFAYFTDREEAKATITSGKASDIIKVTPDGTEKGSEDPGSSLEDLWEKNNPDEKNFIEPGDDVDLGYTLTNIGDGDIDVKETIIITVKDSKGAALNLTANDPDYDPEYRLFQEANPDANGAIDGVVGPLNVTSIEQISANQIKYTLTGFTLEKGKSVDLDYVLVMNKYAGNSFQASTCTVDYLVEMRQHVDGIDPDAEWGTMRTAEIKFASYEEYSVVPAA